MGIFNRDESEGRGPKIIIFIVILAIIAGILIVPGLLNKNTSGPIDADMQSLITEDVLKANFILATDKSENNENPKSEDFANILGAGVVIHHEGGYYYGLTLGAPIVNDGRLYYAMHYNPITPADFMKTVTQYTLGYAEQYMSQFERLDVIAEDKDTGLALVRFSLNEYYGLDENWNKMEIAAATPAAGSPIAVIGHPDGQMFDVTYGHTIEEGATEQLIPIDARTAAGSDGAAVIDSDGKIAGIVSGTSMIPAEYINQFLARQDIPGYEN